MGADDGFGKGCHLHLIDGSAFIFRAYHALPPLTRKGDGLPIGAVAGFCNMLWKHVTDERGADAPTHAAVVFDHSARTFRNDLFPAYKANRTEPPDDLKPQFPLTRDATRAFCVPCLEIEGFEADDIIATLACRARQAGGRVTIVSSDKDLMQLIGDGVEMLDPIKGRPIGPDEVREKFGVGPDRVIDIQALAGDSIDNVPGAPGIGIKTAAQLIAEFGDLDTLLARAAEIPQPRRRQTLIEHADQIRLSRQLVTLDCAMPLAVTLEDLALRDPDPDALLAFLAQMGLRTLLGRVAERLGRPAPTVAAPERAAGATMWGGGRGPAAAVPAPAVAPPPLAPLDETVPELLTDAGALAAWLEGAVAAGRLALAAETGGLDDLRDPVIGLGLATAPGRAAYLPLGHRASGEGLFETAAAGQMPEAAALAALAPVLADPAVLKVGHDIKRIVKLMAARGVTVGPVADVQLMSFALHAGQHGHGLAELADRVLGAPLPPQKDLLGSGRTARRFAEVPPAEAAPHLARAAEATLRLEARLRLALPAARLTTVYETLERPLIPVLAAMEARGIAIDAAVLTRMSGDLGQRLAGIEDEIHDLAGTRFNIGSPKQIGEVLFERMGLAGGRTSGKTGALSTGADVLEDLAAEGHALPGRILDWRQLNKLKSNYTDALPTYVNPDTGRVHTTYAIAGAQTGRLASNEPNLQNIPIRTEEGRRIREAFVAPPGRVLVSLDYSQIELRILAHVAGIPALKQAFRDGIDIHAMTASQMFGVPVAGMPAEVRRRAKAINFGVIYGISGFGLARNLRIPRAEAQAFIDTYFERFPEIRAYMDDTAARARRDGYVQTLFGRRMHTPDIATRGPAAAGARRAAINAPIQGAAADIIRRAMIRMPAALAGIDAAMLLQVHDELVFEAAEDAAPALIAAARAAMEDAARPAAELSVPLIVDAGQGASWGAAH